MRKHIRKLILEAIGDTKFEKKLFGEKFVKNLNDSVFLSVLPIEHDPGTYYMMMDYIENDLGMDLIGQGHFRHVFNTGNPEILLKVATDRTHSVDGNPPVSASDANMQEVQRFNRYPAFFPKSYAYNEDGVWVLVEKIHHVYKGSRDFLNGYLGYFTPAGEIDKNITDSILARTYEEYEKHMTSTTQNEIDFESLASEIELRSMHDKHNTGISGPCISKIDKKNIFHDILKSGQSGSEYEEAVLVYVGDTVSWIFDFLKIDWLGVSLKRSRQGSPEHDFFKTAYSLFTNDVKQKVVSDVIKTFYRSRVTREYFIMMQREKIDLFDIRPFNTGETASGQFKIIDATKF